MSYNIVSAQTYDTITKQKEILRNNPQIPLNQALLLLNPHRSVRHDIAVNPTTNEIYVTNLGSNTVSKINSNTGNVTNIRFETSPNGTSPNGISPNGTSPNRIAINPETNKIYVANSGSNTVSVIDGYDNKINYIPVKRYPTGIAINPETNKIYVANSGSNTVSVIDANNNNKLYDIAVGKYPSGVAAGTLKGNIYVINYHSNTVSTINGSSDKKVSNDISVGKNPYDIEVSPRDKIYVANHDDGTVSVINGRNNTELGKDIPVGKGPYYIAINSNTDKIYVANHDDGTVSVIDGITDKKETPDIPVGKDPSYMTINLYTNKIYVTNSGSNTVSVIDGHNNHKLHDIPVGPDPTVISINPYKNVIYVVNSGSNTVSVIDGSADKVSAGVIFNIEPANSGDIWCNNKEYPTNVYLYVANGTKCIARPDKDFEFSNWIENLGHNSTVPLSRSVISDSPLNSFLSTLGMKPNDTSATFDVNRFGIFAANFKSVPPPIPLQYWIPLYGLIGSTIIGWSLPTIIGSIRARTKRKESVKLFDDLVTSISNATDRQSLDGINNQVIRAYISEKINEFQYKILDKRISEYYRNIIDKRDISANQHNKRSPI